MSEETQVQSDDQVQSNTEKQDETIVATKSAEELAKRLKEVSLEAKTNRQKTAELKRQLEESEKKKLQENGQYKELADMWQRKATETDSQATKLKQAFASKIVYDAIAMEAVKLGAKNVDHVVNLIPLDQIPIDEAFNVDKQSVSAMLEDFKKSNDYMFNGRPGPKVADAIPAKVAEPKLDLSKMSLADRAALLAQLNKQGK